MTYHLRLTLADGTSRQWAWRKLPRHPKSRAMQTMPYGTDYLGCTWEKWTTP